MSPSTGLYQIRIDTVPRSFLELSTIPYVRKDGFIYAQDLTTDFTLSSWNKTVYKIVLQCIIVQLTVRQHRVLEGIANYLDIQVDFKTLRIIHKGPRNESRRRISYRR